MMSDLRDTSDDERHRLLRVYYEMPGDVTAICSCGRYLLDNASEDDAHAAHSDHAQFAEVSDV